MHFFLWLGLALSIFLVHSPQILAAPVHFDPHLDSRAGWHESRAYYMAKLSQDPYWKKRWWLEKTVRVLRGGVGLSAAENVDDLMRLSEKEIVDRLMADSRFGDMVMDFNMYFLGFRLDSLMGEHGYSDAVYDFPAAMQSAREVVSGGDYFKLFDLQAPFYVSHPQIFRAPGEDKLSDEDVVRHRFQSSSDLIDEMIRSASQNPNKTTTELCQDLRSHVNDFFQVIVVLPNGLSNILRNDSKWFLRLDVLCSQPEQHALADLVEALRDVNVLSQRLLAAYLPFVSITYSPKTIVDTLALDVKALGFEAKDWNSWGAQQRQVLANSSTNYDRKRGAYVLKHYFCDDLTPIGVEDPGGHSGGRHASEASCRACHYKLDPMAGFFRDLGYFFTDFKGQKDIIFDDFARADLNQYNESWKAPANSSRTWNVGYIRSPSIDRFNDYGDTLEDLHALFRRAPEVKRCVVRRLFEYVVAEGQTLDGSYLEYLTNEMTKRAQVNSSQAFKWTVAQLLLSQSFAQANLDPNQCYDFGPGYDPTHAAPCRVSFILNKYCASCHDSTTGDGHLDLSSWTDLPDGTRGFPHVDAKSGVPISMATTLAQMVMRLSTADEKLRMPMKKLMSSQDRQELYLWAQDLLNPSLNSGGHK